MSALHFAILGALALAGACMVGVFHRAYDDNLLQRCGLCVVCLGAVAWALTAREVRPHEIVMLLGALLYVAGTLRKVARFRRLEHRLTWPPIGGAKQ